MNIQKLWLSETCRSPPGVSDTTRACDQLNTARAMGLSLPPG
jgi:hypothetical protein